MKRTIGGKSGKRDSESEETSQTQMIEDTQPNSKENKENNSLSTQTNLFSIEPTQPNESNKNDDNKDNDKEIEIENNENNENDMIEENNENKENESKKSDKNQTYGIYKYTEEYMSFVHMEIIEDINQLINEIIQLHQPITFELFKQIWKKQSMNQELLLEKISDDKRESIMNTFYESCFDLFETYETPEEKLLIIFVLYTAYMTQSPKRNIVKIRLPYDIAKHLFALPTQMNHQEAYAMIYKLISLDAFIYASRKSIISQDNSCDIQQNHIIQKLLNEKQQFIPLHSEFENYSDALKMIQDMMGIQNGISTSFYQTYTQKINEIQTENNDLNDSDEMNILNEIDNEQI